MHTNTFLLLLLSLFTTFSLVFGGTLGYDETYDDPDEPLSQTACSDGKNGLLTRGFNFLGDLPIFPNVGAISAIEGWNSSACGSCWRVEFNGRMAIMMGVDAAEESEDQQEDDMYGVSSLAMMGALSYDEGMATVLGVVRNVSFEEISVSYCGL